MKLSRYDLILILVSSYDLIFLVYVSYIVVYLFSGNNLMFLKYGDLHLKSLTMSFTDFP